MSSSHYSMTPTNSTAHSCSKSTSSTQLTSGENLYTHFSRFSRQSSYSKNITFCVPLLCVYPHYVSGKYGLRIPTPNTHTAQLHGYRFTHRLLSRSVSSVWAMGQSVTDRDSNLCILNQLMGMCDCGLYARVCTCLSPHNIIHHNLQLAACPFTRCLAHTLSPQCSSLPAPRHCSLNPTGTQLRVL
jgi:hypothetical protein